MATSHFHKERLSELMRREIADVIAHELRDPRIPSIVTVTKVQLSNDMHNGTVYVSIFDEKAAATEAVAAINNAAAYIQRLVAARVTVKQFPRLYFKYDNSIEHTEHIHRLLKDINNDLE